MSVSVADRQRQYRKRHLKDGTDERLSMVISVHAKRQLERLARHSGTSQRAMLEWQLSAAERRVVACIDDPGEVAAYYHGARPHE